MTLHSTQLPASVRLWDILISLVILGGTTYLFMTRLDAVREAELAAKEQETGDATETFVPDPEPEPDQPKAITKPVKPKAPAPKPAAPVIQQSSVGGYQPRGFNSRGYTPRGFNRRGFNPR